MAKLVSLTKSMTLAHLEQSKTKGLYNMIVMIEKVCCDSIHFILLGYNIGYKLDISHILWTMLDIN